MIIEVAFGVFLGMVCYRIFSGIILGIIETLKPKQKKVKEVLEMNDDIRIGRAIQIVFKSNIQVADKDFLKKLIELDKYIEQKYKVNEVIKK